MESIAQDLAQVVVDRLSHIPFNSRLLVGIAGIPASGKSTLAVLVTTKTNQLLAMDEAHVQSVASSTPNSTPQGKSRAVLVGLDGWHLTRAQLDALPDPKLAHDRRGSHWTFDGHGYASFIRSLREPVSPGISVITAPSFDHAIKDPTPHAITILPEHRIVIIEGLYTFLSLPPWAEAGRLLDERWLIELDPTAASNRLVKRHIASGVAKDLEEACWRSAENDTPSLYFQPGGYDRITNPDPVLDGLFLLSNSLEPTHTIQSVDDSKYALP